MAAHSPDTSQLPTYEKFLASCVAPISLTTQQLELGMVCTVCMDAVENAAPSDVVVLAPCNHYFHTACILPWFRVRRGFGSCDCPECAASCFGTCPNCRRNLFRANRPQTNRAPASTETRAQTVVPNLQIVMSQPEPRPGVPPIEVVGVTWDSRSTFHTGRGLEPTERVVPPVATSLDRLRDEIRPGGMAAYQAIHRYIRARYPNYTEEDRAVLHDFFRREHRRRLDGDSAGL
jgi:hypothetical protein